MRFGGCWSLLLLLRPTWARTAEQVLTVWRVRHAAKLAGSRLHYIKQVRVDLFMGNPSQNCGASPAIWNHTYGICYTTQMNASRLNPRQTRFTYPGGMEGGVDFGVSYIPRWFTCLQTVTIQVVTARPNFCINGQRIEYVDAYVHLGHVISADLNDKNDIEGCRSALVGPLSLSLRFPFPHLPSLKSRTPKIQLRGLGERCNVPQFSFKVCLCLVYKIGGEGEGLDPLGGWAPLAMPLYNMSDTLKHETYGINDFKICWYLITQQYSKSP